MPENLYLKLPSAPLMSQESFNIETIRKYYTAITDLKNKYHEKQWKYKNTCNKLVQIYYSNDEYWRGKSAIQELSKASGSTKEEAEK